MVLWLRVSGWRIPVISISGFLYQRDAFADATVVSDPNVGPMAQRSPNHRGGPCGTDAGVL